MENSENSVDENIDSNSETVKLESATEETSTSVDTAEESAESVMANLKDENTRLKNEFLYLRAEFDNFRKQSIKERSQLVKYGPERLVIKLLDVLDIFDKALAMEVTNENIESFVDGINMTSTELYSALSSFNIEKIDSIGKPFDPNTHEALGSEETDTVQAGHISQVFKNPYKFHDKIIRHGQVIIAKEPTPSTEETDNKEN